ncbi:MAG: RNA-binding S4 domain-containing protein, partial [Flavobacteriales bacterium]
MMEFPIQAPHEYIELNKLLKALGLTETGGEAKGAIGGAPSDQAPERLRHGINLPVSLR